MEQYVGWAFFLIVAGVVLSALSVAFYETYKLIRADFTKDK